LGELTLIPQIPYLYLRGIIETSNRREGRGGGGRDLANPEILAWRPL